MSPTAADPQPSLDEFLATARAWLAANAELRPERVERAWGEGSDSVAVFHNMTFEEEKALVDAARAWQQRKADAGYASIDWAPEFGGGGLPSGLRPGVRPRGGPLRSRRPRTRRWASRWS